MAYVDADPAMVARTTTAAAPAFNPERLKTKPGLVSRLVQFVFDHPYLLYAFARRFAPIATFGDWAFISRYDDVQEVLGRDEIFAVPFGPKIEALNAGPNFLLGMKDGPSYQAMHAEIARAFPVGDAPAVVAPLAADIAVEAVAVSGGRLDAVRDLIALTPTRICERYFGVAAPDERRFAQLTIAMSTFMFGALKADPTVREEALKAGDELRSIIDAAIAQARGAPAGGDLIVSRLLKATSEDDALIADANTRSILVGMICGFVPTCTLAGGNMLEMLLRRPDMMRQAQAAARANDDILLQRCLWEAFRFLPLSAGPFRVCAEDALVAAGTSRAKPIKRGAKMMIWTHSAMFDPRRVEQPTQFDPGREPKDYLLFGFGLHRCIGAPFAQAQITQTLKPLLQMKNLRRASGADGRLAKDGLFPAHLVVEFDPD
jgi:cytochrome P450